MFLDRFIEREIQSMLVHCVHHDQGCDWKDELKKREVIYGSSLFNVYTEELISFLTSLLFYLVSCLFQKSARRLPYDVEAGLASARLRVMAFNLSSREDCKTL